MNRERPALSPASASVQKITLLLKGLRQHPAGALILQQVERMLLDAAAESLESERAYAALLGVLLDAAADALPEHEPLRLQIRLLQHRLHPPLSIGELRALRSYTDRWSERLAELAATDQTMFAQALEPLLRDLGLSVEGSASGAPAQEPSTEQPQAEQQVDLAYRQHLDETNRELQQLQAALMGQIEETIQQHRAFSTSLNTALARLRETEDIADIAGTKRLVMQEAEGLLAGQSGVADRLNEACETLDKVARSSHGISEELSRVRQLSLTDELTGLPNRRAFQRRLEDELARANRYGHPLALTMIDLDEFKTINDTHGHGVGDYVLTDYAKGILSIFRHHDQVARYGGDEFVVLLPDTTLPGALHALDKAKTRARETSIHVENLTLNPPSFSAGVTVFHPGETAQSFISRTDAALYRAKRMGGDRTEVAHDDRLGGVEPVDCEKDKLWAES